MSQRNKNELPNFSMKPFPAESAYATFKENIRQGFSKAEIWEFLEESELDAEQIESGYHKLLFTVGAFIESQLHEGIDLNLCKRYLLDKGYSEEIITDAYAKVRH
jgi:hypothetical protein